MTMAVAMTGCDSISLPGIGEGDELAQFQDKSVEALYNNAMDNLEAVGTTPPPNYSTNWNASIRIRPGRRKRS